MWYSIVVYTDISDVVLIEKYGAVATVNSHGRNNSQTLHCGDIETNYTLEKAVKVKAAAEMVVNYTSTLDNQDQVIFKYPKMVLGVGEDECQKLRDRFQVFRKQFPSMQLLEKEQIAEIEPNVVLTNGKTRFGPTALLIPYLERYNSKTFSEFLRVLRLDRGVLKVFWDLFKVSDIRNYIFKNFMFEIPGFRRWLFLKDVRKIVPSLQLKDIKFAKGFGGVRPQLIDKKQSILMMGEAKINPGNGIVFNMTPSPGASSCLVNAEIDMRMLVDYLGANIDEKRLQQVLHK